MSIDWCENFTVTHKSHYEDHLEERDTMGRWRGDDFPLMDMVQRKEHIIVTMACANCRMSLEAKNAH